MKWAFLAGAIAFEVCGTLTLKVAAGGARRFYALTAAGYLAAFCLLTLALRAGLGIGVAYGVWAAAGVALTAVLSRMVFGDPLTRVMGVGIALVVAGVFLIETGANP